MGVMEHFSNKLVELYQAQKKAQLVTPLATTSKKKPWGMQPSWNPACSKQKSARITPPSQSLIASYLSHPLALSTTLNTKFSVLPHPTTLAPSTTACPYSNYCIADTNGNTFLF
jgi:hypothetical protein